MITKEILQDLINSTTYSVVEGQVAMGASVTVTSFPGPSEFLQSKVSKETNPREYLRIMKEPDMVWVVEIWHGTIILHSVIVVVENLDYKAAEEEALRLLTSDLIGEGIKRVCDLIVSQKQD